MVPNSGVGCEQNGEGERAGEERQAPVGEQQHCGNERKR
jgi:hypothetical protein